MFGQSCEPDGPVPRWGVPWGAVVCGALELGLEVAGVVVEGAVVVLVCAQAAAAPPPAREPMTTAAAKAWRGRIMCSPPFLKDGAHPVAPGWDCPWNSRRMCARVRPTAGRARRDAGYPSVMTQGHDHDYGSDIYTEADGDDDTLANLGPLRPHGRHLDERRRRRRPPRRAGVRHQRTGGRRRRAQRLRRALRAAADRPADQRAAAVLRAALPHPHRQAGRGRDLPRPGRVLALGAGGPHRACTRSPSPRPGAAGRRPRASPTRPSSRSAPRSAPRPTASCRTRSSTGPSAPSASACASRSTTTAPGRTRSTPCCASPTVTDLVDHVDRNTLTPDRRADPEPARGGGQGTRLVDATWAPRRVRQVSGLLGAGGENRPLARQALERVTTPVGELEP